MRKFSFEIFFRLKNEENIYQTKHSIRKVECWNNFRIGLTLTLNRPNNSFIIENLIYEKMLTIIKFFSSETQLLSLRAIFNISKKSHKLSRIQLSILFVYEIQEKRKRNEYKVYSIIIYFIRHYSSSLF